MSKLLKLKQWMTVAEAAERLTVAAGETVTEADLLLFALDSHLPISVFFTTETFAQPCMILPVSDREEHEATSATAVQPNTDAESESAPLEVEPAETVQALARTTIDKTHIILTPITTHSPVLINGLWDLAMIGGEIDFVKNQLMDRLSKQEVTPSLDDLLIVDQEGNEHFSLLRYEQAKAKENHYVPAARMPADALLVVRTNALLHFQKQLLTENVQPEKPFHPSERRSVGQIIVVVN